VLNFLDPEPEPEPEPEPKLLDVGTATTIAIATSHYGGSTTLLKKVMLFTSIDHNYNTSPPQFSNTV